MIEHRSGPSRVGVTAVASYLPEQQVSTADLQDRVAAASGLRLPDGMFTSTTGIAARRMAGDAGWEWSDYARVLVHQVTLPYLDRFVEVTGVPREKLVVTVPELGNVASATLGVQLSRVDADLAPGDRVLLVDNGSTDRTAEIARQRGARVLVEPEKGVGSAVDTGFRYAIAHGATLIARTDAD
jgi:3-oxoacyl-[acyl-carrier-protein] synthase III